MNHDSYNSNCLVWEFRSIMRCAATVACIGWKGAQWMGTTLKQKRSVYIRVVTGMVVPNAFPNDQKKITGMFCKDRSLKVVYKMTLCHPRDLWKAGRNILEAWQCETEKIKDKIPFKTYTNLTPMQFCTIWNPSWTAARGRSQWPCSHIRTFTCPFWWASGTLSSVSPREPMHICERDPAELICKFMEELERLGGNIRIKALKEFMPIDFQTLPKKQHMLIEQWCFRFQGSVSTPDVMISTWWELSAW